MKPARFPEGWNEERVRKLLEHYETQSDEEALAEDEAGYDSITHTTMEIPGRTGSGSSRTARQTPEVSALLKQP